MKKIRKEKGITLIALIITIVVLLILAVVAINAVTGDGIIQHASNAKTDYEKAQALENNVIASYEKYLYDNDITRDKTIKFYIVISVYGDKIEYIAEEGMTWEEFLNSEYNIEKTYKYNDSDLKYTLKKGGDTITVTNISADVTGTLVEMDEKTIVKLDTVITNNKEWHSNNKFW